MRLCNNNAEAWRFIETFSNRGHLLDDIIDGDKPVSDEALIGLELAWMKELAGNQFYQAHQGFLMPLIIMGCNAWLDSNKWEKEGTEVQKVHSDVVKSLYHEVVFACVYLCGGWNALREFTAKHREYQTDNFKKD